MKKKTVKEKLVDRMIAEGNNGIRYTDVIKHVLKITIGEDREYNYKSSDRGWFSDAFNGSRGYFVNGSGNCGLYKKDGKWFAKYYTKSEMMDHAIKRFADKCADFGRYSFSPWKSVEDQRVLLDTFNKNIAEAVKYHKRNVKRIDNLKLA